MVWRNYTRSAFDIARLALELVFKPNRFEFFAMNLGSFENDLVSFFSDALNRN